MGGVYWLSFADPQAVPAEIALCGGVGCLDLRPDFNDLALNDQVQAVLTEWNSGLPRLLIFDNCEDPALLSKWQPSTGGCRVLVTSRRGTWDAPLGVEVVSLIELRTDESVALLHRYLDVIPADEETLKAIADEVGHLPLALHLAGSYLARYKYDVSPAEYLSQLRSATLIEHPSFEVATSISPTRYQLSLARTFTVSYQQLREADSRDGLALTILAIVACLAPGEPIPRDLVLQAATAARAERIRSEHYADAVWRLVELGLLEQGVEGALRMHRLLVAFVRQVGAESTACASVQQVLLERAKQVNRLGYPAALQSLRTHLRTVTDRAQRQGSELAADLSNELGYHLSHSGDYAGARLQYERALAISEQVFGPEHPRTAASLNNLGSLAQLQGDYASSHDYFERALVIRENTLGPEHSDTATVLNNLGGLLREQGDFAGARRYFERATAINERVLGPEHPKTAASLNNLGTVALRQGNLRDARRYLERALGIYERSFGPEHPETAIVLNNLGGTLRDEGDLGGARQYFERALAIRESTLGPDHPDTAVCLSNLGTLLREQGDLDNARPLLERALAIRERALGPEHSSTAMVLNNLGRLAQVQGDYADARGYLERSLAIHEKALGFEHPETAMALNSLGGLLQAEGDLAGAKQCFERALAIREKVLGRQHPDTAISLNNIGNLLRAQGELDGARPYFQDALTVLETVLGPEHTTTRLVRANLESIR